MTKKCLWTDEEFDAGITEVFRQRHRWAIERKGIKGPWTEAALLELGFTVEEAQKLLSGAAAKGLLVTNDVNATEKG